MSYTTLLKDRQRV